MDFGETYGAIGADYIHVHHLTPVSQLGSPISLEDLAETSDTTTSHDAKSHQRPPQRAARP